jgi:hypothetical protein
LPCPSRRAGFVYLRDIAPAIAQDMRYAGYDNFTGHPLPGYSAPECVLRREVAAALASVEADLAPRGLGLKVYDCYTARPARSLPLRPGRGIHATSRLAAFTRRMRKAPCSATASSRCIRHIRPPPQSISR